MGFLFFMIVVIVIIGFVTTKATKRKEQLSTLANELGLSMEGGGFSSISMWGNIRSRSVSIEFTPSGRNTPAKMRIVTNASQPYSFTLSPQNIVTDAKNWLGLGHDLEVGDQSIDDAYEINAPDNENLKKLIKSRLFRKILLFVAKNSPTIDISPNTITLSQTIVEADLTADMVNMTIESVLVIGKILTDADSQIPTPSEEKQQSPEITEEAVIEFVDMEVDEPVDTGQIKEEATDIQPAEFDSSDQYQKTTAIEAHTEKSSEAPPALEPSELPEIKESPEPELPAPSPEEPPLETVESTVPEAEQKESAEIPDSNTMIEYLKNDSLSPENAAKQILLHGDQWTNELVLSLKDFQIRDKVKEIIVILGPKAVPALVSRLDDYSLSFEIQDTLKKLDPLGAQALTAETEKVTEQRGLEIILKAIGELKPDGALECLKKYLHHENTSIRYSAESALRNLGLSYEEVRELKKV